MLDGSGKQTQPSELRNGLMKTGPAPKRYGKSKGAALQPAKALPTKRRSKPRRDRSS
jgi:hypothetical protein